MKKFWIKFLLKLIKINIEKDLSEQNKESLEQWLFYCYKNNGWRQYKDLRKKNLLQLLALGIDKDEEYWQVVGRLKELEALNANINQLGRHRARLKEK